jgi:putative ATP-binding cassette transporter
MRLQRVLRPRRSIALTRSQGRLTQRSHRWIDDLAENFRRIVSVNRNLGFFTTGYNHLIQIIPILLVAPRFIRGEIELGVITQSAMAFGQRLGAFSVIVNQFTSISFLCRRSSPGSSVSSRPPRPRTRLGQASLLTKIAGEWRTLRPGDGVTLISDPSVSIPCGMRVLVGRANVAGRDASQTIGHDPEQGSYAC